MLVGLGTPTHERCAEADLTLDVDGAFTEAERRDGTGGRGANGDLTRALEADRERGLGTS